MKARGIAPPLSHPTHSTTTTPNSHTPHPNPFILPIILFHARSHSSTTPLTLSNCLSPFRFHPNPSSSYSSPQHPTLSSSASSSFAPHTHLTHFTPPTLLQQLIVKRQLLLTPIAAVCCAGGVSQTLWTSIFLQTGSAGDDSRRITVDGYSMVIRQFTADSFNHTDRASITISNK